MSFDNSQFERGTATTLSTLDKLKRALNFKDSSKSLNDLSNASKALNAGPLNGIVQGVDAIAGRFSTLGIVGMQVIGNITNSVMNLGKQMVNSITLDPIIDGLNEYETQINAIQTILANTASKGTTLDQVNASLDNLNTYADKTIYNFAEMTRNIGTFTAAGVDLQTSVDSIKGIANLAAMSGSSSTQASSAMYQLSQAIAAGRVQLMDWNSVVNAGMGGEQFQEALKRTARHFGTNVDGMIEKYGSFRESLTQGEWLTADVLTETLKQISGAYTEADLLNQGYTEDQAKAIVEMAKTAEGAATQVKTFTQLISTLKEALGSGWAQSWRIIIGDFGQAKELFTEISDVLGGAIQKSADARNAMLQGWVDLGGRQAILDGLKTAFESFTSILKVIGDAWDDVFPPMTAEKLVDISNGFKNLMENLKPSTETLSQIGRIAKGVFSAFSLVRKAISSLAKPIFSFLGSDGVGGLVNGFLEMIATIGDFITALDSGKESASLFSGIGSLISAGLGGVSSLLSSISSGFKGFAEIVGNVFDTIVNTVKKGINWISENVSLKDIFAGIGAAGAVHSAKSISGLVKKVKGILDGPLGDKSSEDKAGGLSDIVQSVSGAFDSLGDTLQSFTSTVKVGSLLAIAGAVTLLSVALKSLSKLNANELARGITGIAAEMAVLSRGFRSLTKTLGKFNGSGVIKAGISMILMATALNVMSKAVKSFAKLDTGDLAKGLTATAIALTELVVAIKVLDRSKVSLKTSVALIAVAKACEMLYKAVDSFSDLSWDEIVRGLSGMGGALAEMTASLKLLSLGSGLKTLMGGGSLLIAVQGLKPIADALKDIGSMSWDEIARGLSGMGGALAEMTASLKLLSLGSGLKTLMGGGSLLIAVQGLKPIADALKDIGSMSWDEIARGLVGMGGALAELSLCAGLLGALTGPMAIIGSGSLLLGAQALIPIAQALQEFGSMSWDEIGRGLSAMAGALGEVALGSLINTLSGFGAANIGTAATSLSTLADSMVKWQNISIPEGLAGQLSSLASGIMSFTFGGFGADALSTMAGPLGTLADSVMRWSGVVVPENIGSQLGLLADGIWRFTFGGLGAGAMSTAAGPLGEMANSVSKWSGVVIPENLEVNLSGLARGIESFSFAFLGGFSIGASTGPLGELAGAVKKWNRVTVPDGIESKLRSLANGIKAFDIGALFSSFSADSASGSLGSLAGAVKKWNGVYVPENIGSGLKSLANGIKAFSDVGNINVGSLGSMAPQIQTLVAALNLLGSVNLSGLMTAMSQLATIPATMSALGMSVTTVVASMVASFAQLALIPAQLSMVSTSIMASMMTMTTAFALLQMLPVQLSMVVSSISMLIGTMGVQFTMLGTTIVTSLSMSIMSAGTMLMASGMQLMTMLMQGISIGIPMITSAISSMIANITRSIAGQAPLMMSVGMQMAAALVSGLSSSIAANGPVAISAMTGVISTLISLSLSLLVGAVGLFMTGGMQLMTGLANGIRSASSYITSAIQQILSSALTTITIQMGAFMSKGSEIVERMAQGIRSGIGHVTSAISNISSAVSSAMRGVSNSAYGVGQDISRGLANGVRSGMNWVTSAARDVASKAVKEAKSALDSNSPSKKFIQIGRDVDRGFVIGLDEYKRFVGNKAYDVGKTAVNTVGDTIKSIDIDSEMELNPVVAPVMDMSDIHSKMDEFGKSLQGRTIDVGVSTAQAQSISDMLGKIDENRDEVKGKEKSGDNITFIQNNNSPKALSSIEIYRQTRNQISQLKAREA